MESRQTLKRIAVLLLSLADLAERAVARPRPVLCLVLCLLRPAEAIARCFVAETFGAAALPASYVDSAPSGAAEMRAEAFRLAAAFRLLAAVLGALAVAGAPSSGSPNSRRFEAHGFHARTRPRAAPAAADTS